ncbi:MAG: hypothetical protein RLZZ27_871, partial [Actinomycetota bacterium]
LITAFLSGFLVDRVSLHFHIAVLTAFVFLIQVFVIRSLEPELLKANQDVNIEYKLKELFAGFSFDRLVSFGLICAIFLEFALSDWATIYTKEEIGIKGGLNTLPFILFTMWMIFGRFTVHYLLPRFTLERLAIAASRYAIIVRVDGHSQIQMDYCETAFQILNETGAVNVGGIMAAEGLSLFERSVARAMRSPLGVGASRFHTGGGAGESDTVYLGCFRKEALLAVGGFDERFTRAQDWELNFRLRENGGTVYFDPRLTVTYRPRSTVQALAKQYFEYGRWRRVVSRRHQGTINYRYLAPPFTVLGVATSLILGTLISSFFFIPALVYALFILIASARIGKSLAEFVSLPLILLTMHMTWGTGFLTSPKSLAAKVALRP